MSRDHTKLKVFGMADDLVLQVYKGTRNMPREEQFGLTSQMRRAAVSVASNIVEGCQRSSERDYLRFIEIALGSASELRYLLGVSFRTGLSLSTLTTPLCMRMPIM